MTIAECKNIAVLACEELLNTDKFVVPALSDKDSDNRMIHDLILLYYDYKSGNISRNEAIERQKKIIEG